ncbi:hypothetical protein MmiEs2_00550 [Methanimicrococcus stummii]|uniref:S-layer family duplication domain-containing protein n=1 Tax=Methanimicrococcus stummii TaxID=3028294 RepID=A0AA97A748_9EURY|nr:hypothetical protein [Methanimicrococcus sp. Es2]WNY27878.1 hypothetical protein MmiEs2_00550 [Methanimicrococcus sp. Es2]
MFAVIAPAAADDDRNIIASEEYRIMRDGEVLKLEQGYETVLRGFGPDSVLVEFHNNYSKPVSIGSVVLKEGETIQCFRILEDSNPVVIMMTLDKLYINNSQVLAGFSHIYQYEEKNTQYNEETQWILETAVLDDPTVPQPPEKPGGGTDIETDSIADPFYIILIIGFAAFSVIVISLFFRKRVEKIK